MILKRTKSLSSPKAAVAWAQSYLDEKAKHKKKPGASKGLETAAELARGHGGRKGLSGEVANQEVKVTGGVFGRMDAEMEESVVFYSARAFCGGAPGAAGYCGQPGGAFEATEGERAGEAIVREGASAEHLSYPRQEGGLTAFLGACTKDDACGAFAEQARRFTGGELLASVETAWLGPGCGGRTRLADSGRGRVVGDEVRASLFVAFEADTGLRNAAFGM